MDDRLADGMGGDFRREAGADRERVGGGRSGEGGGEGQAGDSHRRETGGWPTALDSAGKDATWVGRIREDCSHERGLNFWVVADNIRKGAALNSVQIAEILIRDYL